MATRKKTAAQAMELARQSANFFNESYVSYEDAGGEPQVAPLRSFGLDNLPPIGAKVWDPAPARPNELSKKELAAVRAGLGLVAHYLECGILVEQMLKADLGGPLASELPPVDEVRELSDRLIANANKG